MLFTIHGGRGLRGEVGVGEKDRKEKERESKGLYDDAAATHDKTKNAGAYTEAGPYRGCEHRHTAIALYSIDCSVALQPHRSFFLHTHLQSLLVPISSLPYDLQRGGPHWPCTCFLRILLWNLFHVNILHSPPPTPYLANQSLCRSNSPQCL